MFNRPPTHEITDSPGSLGKLAKTDRIDAEIIARFGAFSPSASRHRPDPERAMLSALTARRRQLIAMIIMEKQHADPGHAHPDILPDIARHRLTRPHWRSRS